MKKPSIKQVLQFLSGLMEKLLLLAVIAYIAVSVGRSVYQNHQTNQKIAAIKREIDVLRQEQDHLRLLISYYQTNTFKELMQREQLGWHSPGEQVISVPVEEGDKNYNRATFVPTPATEVSYKPNYLKWRDYFFSG